MKYFNVLMLVILLLISGCENKDSEPKNIVIVIAGQSNAIGLASEAISPSEINEYQFLRTKIFFNGVWQDYNPKEVQTKDQEKGNHGIDVYLAYQFEHDPRYMNSILHIIKYAEGGRPLAITEGRTWSPYIRGNIYDEFIVFGNLAYSKIEGSYKTLGFFWMQGETDSTNLDFANTYHIGLQTLFDTALNTQLHMSLTGKIVIGKISDWEGWTYKDIVRQVQDNYALTHANTFAFDTSTLSLDPVNVGHYSALAYQKMGQNVYRIFTDTF